MADKIFDQLERLQQGARQETRPPRHTNHNSSMEYSAYDDGHGQGYEQPHQPAYTYGHDDDGFVEQPMVLDSFGERIDGMENWPTD